MKTEEAAVASTGPNDSYTVCMLGAQGVGKQTLLSQFRTSECINAYESGRGKKAKFSMYVHAKKFPHSSSAYHQYE